MSDFVVDLSNYRENVGSQVPEGRYTAVVDHMEEGKAKSGSRMMTVWLVIQGGDYSGSTIIDRLVYQGADGKPSGGLFRVVDFMSAVGMSTDRKRHKISPRAIIGKRVFIDVEDGDPYRGRTKSEVRGYGRIAKASKGDGGAGESDADDLDDGGAVPESNWPEPEPEAPAADDWPPEKEADAAEPEAEAEPATSEPSEEEELLRRLAEVKAAKSGREQQADDNGADVGEGPRRLDLDEIEL